VTELVEQPMPAAVIAVSKTLARRERQINTEKISAFFRLNNATYAHSFKQNHPTDGAMTWATQDQN